MLSCAATRIRRPLPTTGARHPSVAGHALIAEAIVALVRREKLLSRRLSEIRVFRDRLVVVAESAGTSLLVLPVEFSHCWDVSHAAGQGGRLVRVNVDQADLLFSGQTRAELRYRFSPWHFRCRFRDIADARTLQLADVGWPE